MGIGENAIKMKYEKPVLIVKDMYPNTGYTLLLKFERNNNL